MSCQLQKKFDCSFQSKLFSKTSKIGGILISGTEAYEKPVDAFSQWAKRKSFKKLNVMPDDSDFVIANISNFKGSWNQSTGGAMKIYNSFNYTQDVKYEARLLELPMKGDLKFIIIVPNECDVLLNLFRTLNDKGLNAAVKSIGPIFVVSSDLKAPSIAVESEIDMRIDDHVASRNLLLTELGTANVDEQGVRIEVMTCIYPALSQSIPEKPQGSEVSKPFYFGVVNEDILIFSGSYCPRF